MSIFDRLLIWLIPGATIGTGLFIYALTVLEERIRERRQRSAAQQQS